MKTCCPRTLGGLFQRAVAFVLAVLATSFAGCTGPQNYMDGAGPAARSLAALGWFTLTIFIVVSALVWVLIAWIAVRRRGTLDWHAPIDVNSGQNWILVGGIAIPVAVLGVVFVATLQSMQAFPMAQAGGHSPEIRLIGRQWWFNAEYLAVGIESPTEIHIPVGRPVEIELQSRDVIHSFWVPKLHGKVDLVPGQKNYIRLQADAPGVYSGQCGEYCGAQHARMRLAVIAHRPADYERWLEHQRTPAPQPSSGLAQRGQEVFMRAACPLCHTVRGTGARGSVGPELTHVASRRRIAGGMLQNNIANLHAWVTHAQSLKPGAQMPDITGFSGEELQALVAYLQTLR